MRKVVVGGAFTSVAAIIATWVAFGVGVDRPKPTLTAYPNATNTGVPAGTTLTTVVGDYQATTDNEVIDAKDVQGQIVVSASGVHIKNSAMRNIFIEFNSRAWNDTDHPLVVEDSTIDCGNTDANSIGTSKPRTGIQGRNFHAFRLNISECENGMAVDSAAVIQDNYIHNLWTSAEPDGPHTDGIESAGGSNLLIQHNVVRSDRDGCHSPAGDDGSCNGTSAINIANSASLPPLSNTLIEDNILSGGTFTLYCPIPSTTNFRVANNRFQGTSRYGVNVGQYGSNVDCAGDIWLGNVYDETGLEVPRL